MNDYDITKANKFYWLNDLIRHGLATMIFADNKDDVEFTYDIIQQYLQKLRDAKCKELENESFK